MPAPPSAAVSVPAKKIKSADAVTFVALPDGRIAVSSVKKGLPKELVAGAVVASIGERPVTSVTQANDAKKEAAKAGKDVEFRLDCRVATGRKPKKDSKVGLSLRREPGVGIVVRKIEGDSIFARTPLKVGQILTRVQKSACPVETKDVIALLKSAKAGPLSLVAVDRADAEEDEEPEPEPQAEPEAAPAVVAPAPSKDDEEPVAERQAVTPDPSDEEPAAGAEEEEPEVVKAASRDDDASETAKDDSDDASSVGKEGPQMAEERAMSPETTSEEKKSDAEGSNWLCCAY